MSREKKQIKISATMKTMDYVKAGILKPEALMVGDFIAVAIDDGVEDIVEVLIIYIDETADNYFIEYKNDFGEKDIITLYHTDDVDWFILE